MKEKDWENCVKRSKPWSIRLGHDLLHSTAYQKLSYASAVKVLNFFHEKVRVKIDKKKRGHERYQIMNDGQISFTYREAAFRGLSSQQFAKAIKELHGRGFIDIQKAGSGLLGDYTVFNIFSR